MAPKWTKFPDLGLLHIPPSHKLFKTLCCKSCRYGRHVLHVTLLLVRLFQKRLWRWWWGPFA